MLSGTWCRFLFTFASKFFVGIIHSVHIRKIFRKTNISYPLIRSRLYAYQGVRNVSFSENFVYILTERTRIKFESRSQIALTFLAHAIILYLLETPKNLRFSVVFRVYKMVTLIRGGLSHFVPVLSFIPALFKINPQKRIQEFRKYLRWSTLPGQDVKYCCKVLHLRCLRGSWECLWHLRYLLLWKSSVERKYKPTFLPNRLQYLKKLIKGSSLSIYVYVSLVNKF